MILNNLEIQLIQHSEGYKIKHNHNIEIEKNLLLFLVFCNPQSNSVVLREFITLLNLKKIPRKITYEEIFNIFNELPEVRKKEVRMFCQKHLLENT